MLSNDKQIMVRGSDYFSEQLQKHEVSKVSNEKDKDKKDPFISMVSSSKLEDVLYVARNPNAPAEALIIASESKFKDNKDLQAALAAHKNTPQKVLDKLDKDVLKQEKNTRKHIKQVTQITKESLNSKDTQDVGEVTSGRYAADQSKQDKRYGEAITETVKEFYDNPDISKEQKEAAKQAGKEYKKKKYEERQKKEEERQKKEEEKKDKEKKKKEELAAAKKGEVSEENIKQGRALISMVEGLDPDVRKSMHSDLKQQVEHLKKLAEGKRKEELKRARKGDFSGIQTPEEGEQLSKADKAHYKEIEKLKKQDAIKRAKKGDFSGTEIPSDTTNMSKEDQRHYKDLVKLKKEDELKRARKGDFSGTEIPSDTTNMSKEEKRHYTELARLKKEKEKKDAQKEKQRQAREKKEARDKKRQKKDEQTSPKSKPITALLDPRDAIRGQLSENRNKLANLSREDAAKQMEFVRASAMAGGTDAAQALQELRSGGGVSSSAALAYMSDVQAQINKQAGAAPPNQSNKPLENTGSMMQSTVATKMQPNTHRLNIAEDRITEMNMEYQQVPEFKRVLA